MKARYFVSYILLSTLVILFLSTGAQATEYMEVKAEDILTQIENGEDVNYKNCHIVGELNVSNIKLETVPNPRLYKLMNEQYDKEVLINSGLSENLLVIESNITITDSIFKNNFNFSNVLFNSSANFSGATFNDSADFEKAIFNDSADFEKAIFNDSADFEKATFNDSANFNFANFNSSAKFEKATFNNSADFVDVTFNSSGDFWQTIFNGITNFSLTIFEDYADFKGATFNGSTAFWRMVFRDNADFKGATFNDSIEFYVVLFNDSADFEKATFNDSANFDSATFNSYATFSLATFHDSVEFFQTTFNGPTFFWKTAFNDSADFFVPDTSENIITDGKTCEFFRKSYNNEALYTDADNIYYTYRKHSQDSKDLTSLSKWIDVLSWITCGYGLKPLRMIYFGGFIVIFFAFFYWRGPGIYRSSDAAEKKSTVSFFDALYFSTNTFTTLGSTDWYPRDKFRKLVTLEGLLGWIMLGLFMATLTNLMIRS